MIVLLEFKIVRWFYLGNRMISEMLLLEIVNNRVPYGSPIIASRSLIVSSCLPETLTDVRFLDRKSVGNNESRFAAFLLLNSNAFK